MLVLGVEPLHFLYVSSMPFVYLLIARVGDGGELNRLAYHGIQFVGGRW